jgi:hypothetical protein
LIYEDEEDDEEYDDDDDYDDSQDGDEHYHHHHHGLSDEYVESRREIFNFGANLMAKGWTSGMTINCRRSADYC